MSGLSTVVKGTGPALLLVHGAGGSVQANYGPILGTLTQYFTVIAPDLPGSGKSGTHASRGSQQGVEQEPVAPPRC